ncbi:hypothetical protein QJQ45_029844, partial [Haematococcus lacustris]
MMAPDAMCAMRSPSLHRIIEGVRASMREQREQQEPPAPKLTRAERDKAWRIIGRSYLKSWMACHGRHVRPPKLHHSVNRVISKWFELVDEDGSGSLNLAELAAALKAAGLPCDDQSIVEMIRLFDLNKDGEVSWQEFEHFLAAEFAAGKVRRAPGAGALIASPGALQLHTAVCTLSQAAAGLGGGSSSGSRGPRPRQAALLSGQYVLPSGTALPFGAMVSALQRDRMMADIMQGGGRRARWSALAADEEGLQAELRMLAQAEAEQVAYHQASALQRLLDTEAAEVQAMQRQIRAAEAAEQRRLLLLLHPHPAPDAPGPPPPPDLHDPPPPPTATAGEGEGGGQAGSRPGAVAVGVGGLQGAGLDAQEQLCERHRLVMAAAAEGPRGGLAANL